MSLVPLYVKTSYSLLTSMIKIKDLINFCKQNGYDAITITDNNMYGVMEFYLECKKNNIKPIIGLETTLDDKKIILYAENMKGYKNIIKFSTIMTERKLELGDYKKYNLGLLAIIPYESISLYDVLSPYYKNIFKGYKTKEERDKLEGDNLVYINETLYLDENNKEYIGYLNAIKTGIKNDDITYNNHLLSREELEKIGDLENNKLINNLCNLKIEKDHNLLPIYKTPNNLNAYDYLKELCKKGLIEKFGKMIPKIYIDRLKYELDVINKMGFCNYFLVVWDYVKFSKDNNILVGPGRGSAAGSLVSYCLNITDVDPIKYNLLFERFLNPERVTMPDIDIDFQFERRGDVINYCLNKYGIKNVAQIITFGTLGAKQVIRDVSKILGLETKKIDKIAGLIDSRNTLIEAYNNNEKLRFLIDNDSENKQMYEIAMKLEGLPRHTSIHAAGIVMSEVELDNIIPLDKSHGNFYTTSYSMNYLEDLGLLKMDFLGLRNLTTISDILKEVNKREHKNLTFETIPTDDINTIKIFTEANTEGIFQFESEGMKNFLRKFKPSTFEDIFSAIALFRPGPMDNIDSYIRRKKGVEKIDYLHDDLINILKPTYGIIVYQEQIMQIANVMAGYSLGEADVLRRAMSKKKKDILDNERTKFISKSIEKGYEEEVANKVYDMILKFANYGFNRAHSVAYAVISYKMAYLKYHYPKYFMSSLLTMVIGSETSTRNYIYECNLNNIKILKPDINLSTERYEVEELGIRFSFAPIKNIGLMACKAIISEREKGKFTDIYDFIKRCYGKTINRKSLESLIDAGCFTSFGLNRKTVHHNLERLINYAELVSDLDEDFIDKPELEIVKEFDDNEIIHREFDLFGFYLSKHPITQYKEGANNNLSINKLDNYINQKVNIIVMIDDVKEILTKNNEHMCFLKVSDETNSTDATLFPRIYEKYNDLREDDVINIRGRAEKRNDKVQIVVDELIILNKSLSKE